MTQSRVHRLVYLLLAVMALVAATLACSPVPQPTPTVTPSPIPPPTATPRPTEPPPASGNVTLLNQSGQTVCYVRMSPSTQTTWGSDWLGSDTVSAGGSYTFDVAPGAWDLRAEDCSNTVIQEDYGITITAAGYTWTVTGTGGSVPPPSGGGNVTVVNSTSQTICYLFASLTTETTWGDDRLGSSGTIAAGASYSFDLTPGAYDMMAMDCSQNEIERNMGVTITAAGYTWTVTGQ
jgi:hypothetical protein